MLIIIIKIYACSADGLVVTLKLLQSKDGICDAVVTKLI